MHTERAVVEKKYPVSAKGYPYYQADAGPSHPRPLRLISKTRDDRKPHLPAVDAHGKEYPSSDTEEFKSFAGGIAHNFNNLLMGINGYVELMLLESPSGYTKSLKKIKELIFLGSTEIYRFLEVACGKALPPALGRRLTFAENGPHLSRKNLSREGREQSTHADKKGSETMTQMADALVEDLNTVLHDIQGIVTLILANISNEHVNYPYLKKVEKLVTKGADMTCQLLHCTRGSGLASKTVRLDCLIKEAVDTFCGIREGINVHLSFPERPFDIVADPCQIDQVLQNLYLNAADAMPQGGDLFLEASNVRGYDCQKAGAGVVNGKYVRVTVRDTGTGMDPETTRHIFEPFFSTKGLKGRGLGLASADRTVQAHGGHIEVDSLPGCGTTFMIYLPA